MRLDWHDATKHGPVYGHLILIADVEGCVHVLDLRAPKDEQWPENWPDDENHWAMLHDRVRDSFEKYRAKWWTYLPYSPPINVNPVPWKEGEDGKPVPVEASDPPEKDFIMRYNSPSDILSQVVRGIDPKP